MKAKMLAHPCHCASAPKLEAESRRCLLVERPEIRNQISRLVHSISHDPNVYEDLLQEALLCLWRAEVAHPGQTVSWYKRRCCFSMPDYLGAGRSVDSLKHRSSACSLDKSEEPADCHPFRDDALLQEVCEQDLFDELMRFLNPAGRQTLRLLREELTMRELARELHLSHVAVIGRRRRISAAAVGLGIDR